MQNLEFHPGFENQHQMTCGNHWDPGIRKPSKAATEEGFRHGNSSRFCQKCRLGPPESRGIPETEENSGKEGRYFTFGFSGL